MIQTKKTNRGLMGYAICACWALVCGVLGMSSVLARTSLVAVTVDEQLYAYQPYTTADGYTYYFAGGYTTVDTSAIRAGGAKYADDYIVLAVQTGDTVDTTRSVDVSPAVMNCRFDTHPQREQLRAHPSWTMIPSHAKSIIVANDPVTFCLTVPGGYLVTKTAFARADIADTIAHLSQIAQLTDRRQSFDVSPSDRVRAAYRYVLEHASYDYDVLTLYRDGGTSANDIPRQTASLFTQAKVVCDGYVRGFLLLVQLMGIEGRRVVGQLQPLDRSAGDQDLFHSRVEINGYYYDPTFEDTTLGSNQTTPDQNKQQADREYFGMTRQCVQLEHTMDGWPTFATGQERLRFIIQHLDHLRAACPSLTAKQIVADKMLVDFISFSVNIFSPQQTEALLCELFEMCVDLPDDRRALIEKMHQYELTFIAKDGSSFVQSLDVIPYIELRGLSLPADLTPERLRELRTTLGSLGAPAQRRLAYGMYSKLQTFETDSEMYGISVILLEILRDELGG